METGHFDFEALQPNMFRMIRSARSRMTTRSGRGSEDGEGGRTGVEGGADSAASRRLSCDRGQRLSLSRSSLVQAQGVVCSENIVPEKVQKATATTGILGDATNTYCTGQGPPAKFKPSDKPSEWEMDVTMVQPDNPQHVAAYAQEIFQKLRREEPMHLPSPTYMERQVHLNAKMRGILVDWLVDVHKKYKLRQETLFLAVQLTDRFLDIQVIAQRQLQLVGATTLMIASKFEEIHPPQLKEFVYVTDKAYSREEILKMEVHILKALQFQICSPTAWHFLERYQFVDGCADAHSHLAWYLLELTLPDYKMLKYAPSHLAAASLLLSNKLLRRPSWTNAAVRHTKMTEPMLKECAKEICVLFEGAEKNSLQALRRKFSESKYHSVAKLNFTAGC